MKNELFYIKNDFNLQLLSLEQIKNFTRIDSEADDALLLQFQKFAMREVENTIGKTILQKQYFYSFFYEESFRNNTIFLKLPPVVSVESVGIDGIRTNNYELHGDRIIIKDAIQSKNILIEYTAGQPDPSKVSPDIINAVLGRIMQIYDSRFDDKTLWSDAFKSFGEIRYKL